LLAHGLEINFARTTTGDGYYVWNRDLGPAADRDLFCFMMLVVANNAVARAASRGNTTPTIRSAFHVGSHYELYQAEGVNPTMFSYIVGDVTIELARMVDMILPHQLMVGDFICQIPQRRSGVDIMASTVEFVEACGEESSSLAGIQLSRKTLSSIRCFLTEGVSPSGEKLPRRFKVTDKHGLSRYGFNLQVEIDFQGAVLKLGLNEGQLPSQTGDDISALFTSRDITPTHSTESQIDDLSKLLKKGPKKIVIEE
jgi:hypothetical protein